MGYSTNVTTQDGGSQDASLMSSNRRSEVAKILVAGSGAVGKTTLVKVLKDGLSLEGQGVVHEYHRTPFLELETIRAQELGCGESNVVLLMVDVAGQLSSPIHAIRDLSMIAIKNVRLVLLLCAADNLQSLLDLKDWVSLVKTQTLKQSDTSPRFVIVINKNDLEMNIDLDLVERIVDSEPLIINQFGISCKTGQGMKEFSEWLVNNTKSV
jgi:GTPase SAR1 family protein